MLHFKSMRAASEIFKALSAPMRLRIMEILYDDGTKNLDELAKLLSLTNSAISLHIKKLEEAGLIEIHSTPGKRGSMKICKPIHNMLIVDLYSNKSVLPSYDDNIQIGYYSNCKITATCGISTTENIIGEFDDPRYFLFPEHFNASILWFTTGFVEYNLPNRLIAGQKITEIRLSFEISSESPGFNENYPSDIYFSINGISLGYWVSPGDFGARRGRFTPNWWPDFCNQYGRLKVLTVNSKGTFIDGDYKISETKIEDLNIDYTSTISFRFSVPKDTKNPGGFTIFGEGFGDYNQNLRFKVFYENVDN